VREYNRQNPREEPLVDPSSDVIEVTLLLSTWYRLFRWCNPPTDEEIKLDMFRRELQKSTDESYKIPKPRKNARVLKSTSGTGQRITGNI
jgi:hypothetical protein